MKRLLTLALVALTATASQALTVDWSYVNKPTAYSETTTISKSDGSSADIVVNPSTLSTDKSFVAYAHLDVSSFTAGSGGLFYLSTLISTTTYSDALVFGSIASGDIYFYPSYSSGTAAITTLKSGSSVDIVYAYDASNNQLAIYISDGTTTYSGSVTLTEGTTLSNLQVGGLSTSRNDMYNYFDNYADYTAETYVVQGATAVYTANGDILTILVPEPTALALLALGVAGLALRRKAA